MDLFAQIAGQLSLTLEKSKLYQELTKRNHFIRKVFGRYLTNEIAKTLLDDPRALKLGVQKCKVTVLMSDLRSFTAMSEALSPEEVGGPQQSLERDGEDHPILWRPGELGRPDRGPDQGEASPDFTTDSG